MNSTAKLGVVALASIAWLGLAPAAFADEVTHSETTTTHKNNDAGVPAAVGGVVGGAVGAVVGEPPSDCTKTKVTKTDEDTGDTVTKTKRSCD